MSQASDAELVRQVQRGKSERFAELVRRYHGDCLRYAFRMPGEMENAEEVVQDAFVRAYRSLPHYQERGHFRAWLFRILVNQCRTMMVRQRRAADIFVPFDSEAEEACGGDLAVTDWSAAVGEALQRLTPPLREALLLHVVDEFSYEEIAATTGAGISAVKMRVARAREQLRTMLRERQNA